MSEHDGFMKALKCRECGREYPLTATHVCEFDFGPLEVAYDYDRIKKSLTKAAIQSRPKTMWRYRELLPVAERTDRRPAGRLHAARQGRPARQETRHPRTLGQERHGQLPHPLVQGPRRERGVEPRARTRLRHRRLRLDRQSGQFRRRQCRGRRIESLRVHSVGSGAGQNRQLAHLRRDTSSASKAITTR